MSRLREQLQSARRSYESIRYPGDLAAELFAPRISRWRIVAMSGLVGGAIAAAVAVVLLLRVPTAHRELSAPQVANLSMPDVSLGEIPAMPDFPADIEITPPYQVLSFPSAPSFSLEETSEKELPNPKESV